MRGRLRPPIERDFGFADKPISGYAREARLSGRIVAWPAPSAASLCGWRGFPSLLCRRRFIVQSGSWASVEAGRLGLRTRHARAYARLRLGRSKRGAVAGRLGTGAAGGRAPLVHGDAHRTGVSAMGERADVLRAMHRALRGSARECVPVAQASAGLVGRVVGKGLGDALNDRGCLVVDGLDGRAHLRDLPAGADLAACRWMHRGAEGARRLARRQRHDRRNGETGRLSKGIPRRQPSSVHRRRPGRRGRHACPQAGGPRRAGVVERLEVGVRRIPSDDLAQAGRHDERTRAPCQVLVTSCWPPEPQVRAPGATWRDQEILWRREPARPQGFGHEVPAAMQRRRDFLAAPDSPGSRARASCQCPGFSRPSCSMTWRPQGAGFRRSRRSLPTGLRRTAHRRALRPFGPARRRAIRRARRWRRVQPRAVAARDRPASWTGDVCGGTGGCPCPGSSGDFSLWISPDRDRPPWAWKAGGAEVAHAARSAGCP